MRFNNDDYLKAFPREARGLATPAAQPNNETPAGDVFDQGKEPEDKQDLGKEPEDNQDLGTDPEGGAENGNE